MSKPFQFHSDIHLEFYTISDIKRKINRIITPDSDYCILSGDICKIILESHMYEILKYCADNFVKTYYIAGNHEYYSYDDENIKTIDELSLNLSELINKINSENHYGNVKFLDNDYDTFISQGKKYIIYGTTLWSKIPYRYEDTVLYQQLKDCINDYENIYVKHPENFNNENISPDYIRKLYDENIVKLTKFLDGLGSGNSGGSGDGEKDYKLIIASHHAPLNKRTSDPKYEINKHRFLNCAYASDLSDLIEKYSNKINYWIFGHTHFNSIIKHHGVKIISNQCGYKSQHGKIHYKQSGVLID